LDEKRFEISQLLRAVPPRLAPVDLPYVQVNSLRALISQPVSEIVLVAAAPPLTNRAAIGLAEVEDHVVPNVYVDVEAPPVAPLLVVLLSDSSPIDRDIFVHQRSTSLRCKLRIAGRAYRHLRPRLWFHRYS